MVATRPKAKKDSVQYWLPDPADLERLIQLLEICGYTDECMAREEATQDAESSTILEVTVRKREISTPQLWYEEPAWIDAPHEGVWQA